MQMYTETIPSRVNNPTVTYLTETQSPPDREGHWRFSFSSRRYKLTISVMAIIIGFSCLVSGIRICCDRNFFRQRSGRRVSPDGCIKVCSHKTSSPGIRFTDPYDSLMLWIHHVSNCFSSSQSLSFPPLYLSPTLSLPLIFLIVLTGSLWSCTLYLKIISTCNNLL